jgi:hypothetical protein
MKIEIPESLRVDIDAAISKATANATEVRNTSSRIDEIKGEQEKSTSKISAIFAVEVPSEKQVSELIIAERRQGILDRLLTKFANQLDTQKRVLIGDIREAGEIFRRSVGKQLTEEAKRQLIESLPPSVKSNDNLAFSVWAGSSENRTIGTFLNSPLPSHKDDAETILAEADRIVRLLRDVLDGNDIAAVPSSPALAA